MSSRVISAVLTLRDRDFSSNIARAAARGDDLGRAVAHVGNKVQSFGKTAKSAFKSVAASAAKVSFAGISTGVGIFAATVGNTILEMESAFDRLEAKTGTTGHELEELSAIAKDVFKQGFGESISQVADDVATLNSMFSNLDYGEVQTITEGAYTISQLWGEEVQDIGKTISTMTKTFDDLSASEALDILTVSFQQTGDMSKDLLDTFNEYSTQFKALGYDAEGFAATLIAGAKSGVFNFDKLADAAKESFLKLGEGSNDTIAALELMGLDANKVMSDIAQGGDTANQAFIAVSTAIGTIEDSAARNQAAIAAFGTPLEDLGPQFQTFFSDVNQDLGDFEGATQRAADSMQGNFKTKITQAWRDLQVTLADLANNEGAQELLNSIATKAQEMVPTIENLAQKAIDFANSIRDNWGPIKETIIGIGTAVGTFAVVMGGLKIISFVTTLISGFRNAMALATAGQWALTTATLASPWTWLAVGIAAVVAVGVTLYRNWDTVKEKAGQLWQKIQDNPFAMLLLKMNPITGVAIAIYKNFDKIKEAFNSFKKAISNFKLPSWVSSIGSTISGAASKVGNLINGSHATGLNRVPFDGYIAELHKDEMVIPARQAERLRQQGVDIDNIDKTNGGGSSSTTTTTTVTNKNSSAKNNVEIHIHSTGTTTAQVIKELVPQLKLVLANL